ncbi:hypothetical protein GLOIN_2v1479627 [Rhizophagus irregularis DAOM 181602=DAOM 197198]|nr:hypothetical protein GLOIN_2v1479627 [Rhizophagus irregularis DAOM 181602=DAOM 197198]
MTNQLQICNCEYTESSDPTDEEVNNFISRELKGFSRVLCYPWSKKDRASIFYIKNFLRQHRDWVESVENPVDMLNFSCMTIGKIFAKACFEHAGYL